MNYVYDQPDSNSTNFIFLKQIQLNWLCQFIFMYKSINVKLQNFSSMKSTHFMNILYIRSQCVD